MKLLQEYINMPIFNFLCVYISVVWVVWLNSFAVIRYLSALNFYLGIIISVALLFFSLLIKRPKTYFIFLFIFILLNIWTTMFFSWGKQIPHSLYEPVLDMKIPDNAVVLSAGLGVGYIAPFQNSKAHYVYGCTHLKENFNYSQKAFEKVRNLMKLGEVFVLYNKDRVDEDYSEIEIFTVPKSYNGDLNMLDRYQIDYDSCKFIHNLYGNKTYLCKVVKVKQEK